MTSIIFSCYDYSDSTKLSKNMKYKVVILFVRGWYIVMNIQIDGDMITRRFPTFG